MEPGEIETVIGQHKDVRKAAVVVRALPTGDKQLVAYFVPSSKVRALDEIGHWLAGRSCVRLCCLFS